MISRNAPKPFQHLHWIAAGIFLLSTAIIACTTETKIGSVVFTPDESPTSVEQSPTLTATYDEFDPSEPVRIEIRPVVLGVVKHSYATATTPSRRLVEMENGSIHAIWWDGEHVVGRSALDGLTFGTTVRVSHVSTATGPSMVAHSGVIYIVYTDSNGLCAYERSGPNLLQLGDPRTIHCSNVSFSVQWPAISIGPDGHRWLVFRSTNLEEGFDVFAIRGDSEPITISNAEHRDESGAGTTGAVFFPGGKALILHGGLALHASTTDGHHQVVAENYRASGTHGFAGLVIGERLYVTYATAFTNDSIWHPYLSDIVYFDLTAELRTFTWTEGWSEAKPMTFWHPAIKRSLGLTQVGEKAIVVGYDGQRLWWSKDGILRRGIKLDLISHTLYVTTASHSKDILMMWQDGIQPGALGEGSIYFLRIPGDNLN